MRSRHGPFRRAELLGVLVAALALAFVVPAIAFAYDPVAIPIQGSNRYLTAVAASEEGFDAADTVVVATGEAFPDGLGGAALAGAVNGPLLLTRAASVPTEVLDEIDRLGATKIYVLGSTAAVSAAAFAQLDAAIAGTPVRLGGANRYATAKLVADKTIQLLGDDYDGGAIMATGLNFPDALASSPIMFAKGMPLVLVTGSGGYTLSAGMTEVTILGSESVVPASVEAALGAKFEDRIFGDNRYETAAEIADWGVSMGLGWDGVGVATGESFPDALCGGPLVGAHDAVMLLTTSAELSEDAADALLANKSDIDEYYLFGGTTALSEDVRDEIAYVVAGPSNSHALPEYSCTVEGCHATDLATIHIARGCYMCHGRGNEPSNDCASCHGAIVHENAPELHAGITSDPETPAESCTQAACHGTANVLTLHENCAQCHASSDDDVRAAIEVGDAACESCHDYDTVHSEGSEGHTMSGDCFGSTCHGTDVARLHSIDFRGTGNMPPGCVCHNDGPLTTNCTTCHENLALYHDEDAAHEDLDIAGELSAGCVTCHGSDLMKVAPGEHVGCTCHAYAIVRGKTECLSCHVQPMDPDAPHPFHVGDHDDLQTAIDENSPGCVSCHGNDLLAVLPAGNPATGVLEHKGCSCHAYHEAEDQEACEDCHVKPMDPTAPYPYHVGAHDDLEDGIAGETSSACVTCHGTNLLDVSAGSPDLEGEHRSCLCHAYGEAEPENDECAACHKGQYAAHGFDAVAAGHSTTTYGFRGMREFYDGSDDGVVVKDTLGAPIQGEWAIPTARVFWDPDGANTPADAFFGEDGEGLDAESVITCEDCHTGLEALVGPQGANAGDVGIDPNFPQPYKNAVLSYYQTATGTSTAGVPYTRDPAKSGINYRTSWETTDAADLRVGDGEVICAKCHDLWEENAAGTASADASAAAFFGFANFAHEEHSRNNAMGRGDCVNCHAAIPHGWKRPRLLIQSYEGTVTYTDGTTDTVSADPYPYSAPRGYWQAGGPNGGWGSRLPEFQGAIGGLALMPAVWGDNADTARGYVAGGPGDHPPVEIPQIGEMNSSFIAPEWQERSQDCQAGCGGSTSRHAKTVHRAFIE